MTSHADGDDDPSPCTQGLGRPAGYPPRCTAQIPGITGLALLARRGHMVGMRSEPALIKRYGGGRLYDAAALRYLSLDDLAELVARGERFIVRDAKTDNDITQEILDRLR